MGGEIYRGEGPHDNWQGSFFGPVPALVHRGASKYALTGAIKYALTTEDTYTGLLLAYPYESSTSTDVIEEWKNSFYSPRVCHNYSQISMTQYHRSNATVGFIK